MWTAGIAWSVVPAVADEVQSPPNLPEQEIGAWEDMPCLPASPRFVVGVDYLNWWLREGRIPAVLTTSSPTSQGILGKPDTEILYGNQRLQTRHGDEFGGIRPTLSYWFTDERTVGVELSAFFLERDSTYFKAVSDGNLLLARPYLDASGAPASYLIAGPTPAGPLSGQFVGYSRIELFGEEANALSLLMSRDSFHLSLLGGARLLQMRDRNDLTSSSRTLPDQSTLYGLEDHYRTANDFYGVQLGLISEFFLGRWSIKVRKTISLGANAEEFRAFGTSIYQTPSQRIQTPTGLLVQTDNSGTFRRTVFSAVSTVQMNVSYQLSQRISVFGGYTLLLWENPIRAGDQLNTTVNPSPTARPFVPFKEDLFWAQGINLGAALAW